MQVSAIFAMGRSADKIWGPQVCAELRSLAPEIRFEAARAAGELELAEAVTDLVELTQDIDPQVGEAAIWSLSQVGGDQARQALVELLEAEDADEDFIQEALDNLDFTDEVQSFLLLDVDEADEPDDLPPGLTRNGRSPN
jgi:HEAT repeat protein